MPTSISWDEFRLVKAIADAKSLVGAADKLGINHSTVFRRLGALEEAFGARFSSGPAMAMRQRRRARR